MDLSNVKGLTNHQLDKKLKGVLGKIYVGTNDFDSLPTPPSFTPWACIVNTLKDTENQVGHWCAIVVDKRGFGHFFDSYGQPVPHVTWVNYLKNISKNGRFSRTTVKIQPFNTNICGHLCALYIIERLRSSHLSDNQIARSLDVEKSVELYNRLK